MLCGDILPMISETRQCNIGSDNAEIEEKEVCIFENTFKFFF